MRKPKSIIELKTEDIENQKNRPAIYGFRDNLSLGAVLEKAYITPRYHLHKHGVYCIGIEEIIKEYSEKNLMFVGDGGTGKTSAFLRLYMGFDEKILDITNKQFFYFFAPDLIGDKRNLNGYQRAIREKIESGDDLDGILLLDGLEEAYANDGKGASEKIEELKAAGITIWVSCRTSFYERLDDKVIPYFADRITIHAWEPDDFINFVDNCLKDDERKEEIKARIDIVKQNVESLLKRPLFATMALFVAERPEAEEIHNEYDLIELFLFNWIERERKEKGIEYDKEKCYTSIRDIALSVYLKTEKRPKLDKSAIVFRDLLVMSNLTNNTSIHGFSHREFLVYFIVNALVDAARYHPDKIVWWFSQTFYDDITNMIKPVLYKMNREDAEIVFNNLFSVYRETYEKTSNIEVEMINLGLTPEESFLKLRDEILYFVLKIPNVDHERFAQYAYNKSSDIMLFLGIAYGMAQIDPNNPYTLEFANRLKPGSPEEERNRGWGMCFFGDVEDNGYTYLDNESKPWEKMRKNRLRRLSDNEKKHLTRVLDLPLLYCFYYSREFNDCTSYSDYQTILTTNISLKCFKQEQQSFMREQKELLVSKYREKLLLRELNTSNLTFLSVAKRERISMNPKTNNAVLELDDVLAERILQQIAFKESVYNNIKAFWKENGAKIIEKYTIPFISPNQNKMSYPEFEERIRDCRVLLISANRVEGITITYRLMQESHKEKLDTFPSDNQMYQFATIESIPIVHIWPNDTSSFTQYGSFSALDAALDRFTPKYVFSVGVAFGIDPIEQSLGDVLISRAFVPYDSFNKVTDGKAKLRPQDAYRIAPILESQLHNLETKEPPKDVGDYKWYYNAMLTGGTVLSDAEEKKKLQEAAGNNGYEVIGGEMEASGVYYACQKIKGREIPFMTIKGICDWGAEKNSWNEVLGEDYDRDDIKDRVQAYACDNAYDTLHYILSQLNMNL